MEPVRPLHRSLDERDRRESFTFSIVLLCPRSSHHKVGAEVVFLANAEQYRVLILSPLGHLLGDFAPYVSLTPSPAAPSSTKLGTRPSRPFKAAPAPSAPAKQPPPRGGEPLSQVKESAPDRARSERSTAAYVGLGIRTLEWHPSGEYLAIGGWDGKVSRGFFSRFLWYFRFSQARSATGLCTYKRTSN